MFFDIRMDGDPYQHLHFLPKLAELFKPTRSKMRLMRSVWLSNETNSNRTHYICRMQPCYIVPER